jgi:predicted small integral membrane protein
MEHRYLKIALTLSVGLLALFYVTHNIVNWDAATGAVGYVLSQQDHRVYPESIAPAIASPAAHTGITALICAGELAAAIFSLIGAWRLWSARNADVVVFATAKRNAVIGSGLAALVWFFLFAVFGGALYQMWQTEVGAGSLEGAWQFSGLSFLTLIYLTLPHGEAENT